MTPKKYTSLTEQRYRIVRCRIRESSLNPDEANKSTSELRGISHKPVLMKLSLYGNEADLNNVIPYYVDSRGGEA